jgi:hypothetical protein
MKPDLFSKFSSMKKPKPEVRSLSLTQAQNNPARPTSSPDGTVDNPSASEMDNRGFEVEKDIFQLLLHVYLPMYVHT